MDGEVLGSRAVNVTRDMNMARSAVISCIYCNTHQRFRDGHYTIQQTEMMSTK